jgi:hypothetical protein
VAIAAAIHKSELPLPIGGASDSRYDADAVSLAPIGLMGRVTNGEGNDGRLFGAEPRRRVRTVVPATVDIPAYFSDNAIKRHLRETY